MARERKRKRAREQAAGQQQPRAASPQPQQFNFLVHERGVLSGLFRELWEDKGWLAVITILALVVRFWNLSQASLWMDEIVILQEAYTGEFQTVSGPTHRVHLAAVGFFMHLLGQTEFGLRFFGALLGGFAVPLAYVWGRWMMDRATGFVLSLLMLANCFLVLYAQDGNYYGTVTFFTMVSLCAYGAFFRGAPHAAVAVLLISSALAYKTHPVTVLPAAVLFGGVALGALIFPTVRGWIFTPKPSGWKGRPAFPLLVAAVVLASPLWISALGRSAGFLSTVIRPGESTLTNVEFGWPLFQYHLTSFGVTFFHPKPFHAALMWFPFVLFLAGFPLAVWRWWRDRQAATLAFAGLALVLPLASYIMLFSLQLNRNFNLRYFIYLVPPFLGMIAVTVVEVRRLLAKDREAAPRPWKDRALLTVAAAPVLLMGGFTAQFLLSDLSNYRKGMDYLKEHYAGERIVVPSRNDLVQSRFYLEEYGLPHRAPKFAYFNTPPHANVFAGAFSFMFHGSEDVWFLSAWRFLNAHNLYDLLESLDVPYRGVSRLDERHSLIIHRWDYGDRVILPHAAARFRIPEGGGEVPVLAAGPGSWRAANASADIPAISGRSGRRFAGSADGSEWVVVPELPATITYEPDQAASQPEHSLYRQRHVQGEAALRNERDGSYDFLVFQPSGEEPRQLVVRAVQRDEQDPLLNRNNEAIAPGHMISVAVNGRHAGFWPVDSGTPEIVRIPIDLDLPPGNHRITVGGLQPRIGYTPYFPWLFAGIEWNATTEQTIPSLEERGEVGLSRGWETLPATGEPGAPPPPPWQIAEGFPVTVDPDVRGPAGDHAIRIDFPGDWEGGTMLLCPPMPVEPGTLATYWFYFRMDGVEKQELTPMVHLIGAQGNDLGGFAYSGPNHRSTTFGNGWQRRQITVPVPDGVTAIIPRMQFFPYEGETEHGRFWLASFGSPGTDTVFADPQLPPSYFGFGSLEDALDR